MKFKTVASLPIFYVVSKSKSFFVKSLFRISGAFFQIKGFQEFREMKDQLSSLETKVLKIYNNVKSVLLHVN